MHALFADAGFAFGLMLIMALAAVVAVVGVFGLVLKVLGVVFRGIFGSESASPRRACAGPSRRGVVECPHGHCGHLNPPGARYCAQCGMPLRAS